jgi:hypothetical protein
MKRNCDVCQIPYQARRASSRFCSARCRQRAQRSPSTSWRAPVAAIVKPGDVAEGYLTGATLAELEAADMVTSSLGQLALLLARRLDTLTMDTGSSIAALVREHRATLNAAVGAGTRAVDPLDQLAMQRRLRLSHAR